MLPPLNVTGVPPRSSLSSDLLPPTSSATLTEQRYAAPPAAPPVMSPSRVRGSDSRDEITPTLRSPLAANSCSSASLSRSASCESSMGWRADANAHGAGASSRDGARRSSSKDNRTSTRLTSEDIKLFTMKEPSATELAAGYRLLKRPDVKYLGFIPNPFDERPFINALAINGELPYGSWFQWDEPVSPGQKRSGWIVGALGLVLVASVVAFAVVSILGRHDDE